MFTVLTHGQIAWLPSGRSPETPRRGPSSKGTLRGALGPWGDMSAGGSGTQNRLAQPWWAPPGDLLKNSTHISGNTSRGITCCYPLFVDSTRDPQQNRPSLGKNRHTTHSQIDNWEEPEEGGTGLSSGVAIIQKSGLRNGRAGNSVVSHPRLNESIRSWRTWLRCGAQEFLSTSCMLLAQEKKLVK